MSLFQTINNGMFNQHAKQNTLQAIMQSNNPQQLAMQMLQQADPEKFKMIQTMMSQGLTPQQAMQKLGFSQQQLDMIKSMGGFKR